MTPLLVLVCMHTNWNWLAVKHRIYEDLCLTRSAEVPWDLKGLQASTLMSQFDLKHEENTSPSCSMAATLVPCLVNGMGSPVWSFLGLNFLHPKVDELPTCTQMSHLCLEKFGTDRALCTCDWLACTWHDVSITSMMHKARASWSRIVTLSLEKTSRKNVTWGMSSGMGQGTSKVELSFPLQGLEQIWKIEVSL